MTHEGKPDAAALQTLRSLLEQLGVTPEHLLSEVNSAQAVAPTFDEYVPQVANAVSPGTRRVYRSYWQRICRCWGQRQIVCRPEGRGYQLVTCYGCLGVGEVPQPAHERPGARRGAVPESIVRRLPDAGG